MNLISTLKMTALSTALLLVGCSSSTITRQRHPPKVFVSK